MCNPILECSPSGQKALQLISATASNCLGYASDFISLLRGLENPKGSVGLSLSQTDGLDSLDPFSGLAFPPSEVPPFIYCHIKKGMATVRGSARVSCPLSASSRRAVLVRSPVNVPFCSTDASMLNLICSILFSWFGLACPAGPRLAGCAAAAATKSRHVASSAPWELVRRVRLKRSQYKVDRSSLLGLNLALDLVLLLRRRVPCRNYRPRRCLRLFLAVPRVVLLLRRPRAIRIGLRRRSITRYVASST